MRLALSLILTAVGIICSVNRAVAANIEDALVSIPVAPSPPRITGNLSDLESTGWHTALKLTKFFDFSAQAAAPRKTTAYLTYDSHALYLAVVAEQDKVTATVTGDDTEAMFADDYVAFCIDPTPNGSRQYYFSVNANGAKNQSSSDTTRYFPIWTAHGSSSVHQWFAELVIPMAALHIQSKHGQPWRINVVRYIASSQHYYSWASSLHMSSPYSDIYWNEVLGVNIPRSVRLPTSAKVYSIIDTGPDRDLYEIQPGNFQAEQSRSIGLDLIQPISSNLSFVGTFHPDYSGLENDQLIIGPQQFKQQYAEYRPFFSEGAQFLPASLYTPSIGVFNDGEKVEGTSGLVQMGLMHLNGPELGVEAAHFAFQSASQTLSAYVDSIDGFDGGDDATTRDVGVTATSPTSGLSAGAQIGSQAAAGPEAQSDSAFVSISRPLVSAAVSYVDKGPDYNPWFQYVPINDIRGLSASLNVQTKSDPNKKIKSAQLFVYGHRYFDDSGAVHNAGVNIGTNLTFSNLFSISAGTLSSYLRLYDEAYPKYTGPSDEPYRSSYIGAGVGSGTNRTLNMSYSWGTFGISTIHYASINAQNHIGQSILWSGEYDDSWQRLSSGNVLNDRLLRTSLAITIGRTSDVALNYRVADGSDYIPPWTVVSISIDRRYASGDELMVEFGSPAANRTLNRVIVKYVFSALNRR